MFKEGPVEKFQPIFWELGIDDREDGLHGVVRRIMAQLKSQRGIVRVIKGQYMGLEKSRNTQQEKQAQESADKGRMLQDRPRG